MDKIIAIKIKNSSGGYDEIPITALAQNVYWDSNLNLNLKQHIIGNIATDTNSNIIPIQNQIDSLNSNKANLKSPVFTGTPKSVTPAATDNSTRIATTAFVKNQVQDQLKTSDLKTSTPSALTSSSSTSVANQQYPVIFDNMGHLSVNVPWTDTLFSSSIDNLWTGVCSASSSTVTKNIVLDNPSDFPTTLTGNEMLAVYFKNRNTANNPKIKVNNINYSIGFLKTDGTIGLLTTIDPFYKFGSGLRFFTYEKNKNCWLLSTADYSAISYLNDNKANLNSPIFTGTPQIKVNGISTDIATTDFVNSKVNNQLKTTDLETSTQTNLKSEITSTPGRQYSVVFDSAGKLSVNVPWIDSGDSIQNIQKLWTGICKTENNIDEKIIILNNENNNYGGMISITDGNSFIVEGSNILIYFQQGNNVISPTLTIHGTNLEKDILYQSGPNIYSKVEDNISYYQWGPGLKIFTYVKYTENNEQKDGWVISSFDGLVIKNLNDRLSNAETKLNTKANINSPSLKGVPTTSPPSGTVQNQISTVGYVQSECSKILNADENYAFQLKGQNSNRNIFAVDWDGNANGIDLNCFHTEGILKSRPESTIIGKYNNVSKNATGLFCGDDVYCADDLMVGGTQLSYDSGNYAFAIGSGTDNNNRMNIFDIDWEGRVRIRNSLFEIGVVPSETIYHGAYTLADKNDSRYGVIQGEYTPEDDIRLALQVERNVNNSRIFHAFRLGIHNDGTKFVTLDSEAWRKALQLTNTLDSYRIQTVSKTNVEIDPNSTTLAEFAYTDIPGFTVDSILKTRIDGTGTTNPKNASWCFVYNSWHSTNDKKIHINIRNFTASKAIITVYAYLIYRRTSL